MKISLISKIFDEFVQFIISKDGKFFSFESQPYLKEHETYKFKVNALGYQKLEVYKWTTKDIGSGKILNHLKEAILVEDNNLLIHDDRRGKGARQDKSLYKKYSDIELRKYEKAIYDFYRNIVDDEISFSRIIEFSGKQYPFIAYLFFLKSKKKYLPIAPKTFDQVFEQLGLDLRTSRKCSWENYIEYLNSVEKVRNFLQLNVEFENEEITLLDAHSFLWVIGSHMKDWKYQTKLNNELKIRFVEVLPSRKVLKKSTKKESNSEQPIDYLKDYLRKNRLGAKSEDIVYHYLKIKNKFVNIVSDNPLKGYDIEVCNNEGHITKRIEVKTESINNSFILTKNELEKSQIYEDYYVYIVKNPDSNNPIIQSLKSTNFLNDLTCEPINFRVYF